MASEKADDGSGSRVDDHSNADAHAAVEAQVALLSTGSADARTRAVQVLARLVPAPGDGDASAARAAVAAGAVKPLVDLIGTGSDDAQVGAARLLARLAASSADATRAVVDARAIDLLVGVVGAPSSDAAWSSAVATLVQLAATGGDCCRSIVDAGAMEPLMRRCLSGNNAEDANLTRLVAQLAVSRSDAAAAIGEAIETNACTSRILVGSTAGAAAARSTIVLRRVLRGLTVSLLRAVGPSDDSRGGPVGDAERRSIAWSLLERLGTADCLAFAESGAIATLVACVHTGSEHTKVSTLNLLLSLVCTSSAAASRALVEAEALPHLVALLRNDSLREVAAKLLASIAASSTAESRAVVDAGTVEPLLAMLGTSNAWVCANAVRKLANSSRHACLALIGAGAIRGLARLLHIGIDRLNVYDKAAVVEALVPLVRRAPATAHSQLNVKAIGPLTSMLREPDSDGPMRNDRLCCAAEVLTCLAASRSEALRAVVDAGAIKLLVGVMRRVTGGRVRGAVLQPLMALLRGDSADASSRAAEVLARLAACESAKREAGDLIATAAASATLIRTLLAAAGEQSSGVTAGGRACAGPGPEQEALSAALFVVAFVLRHDLEAMEAAADGKSCLAAELVDLAFPIASRVADGSEAINESNAAGAAIHLLIKIAHSRRTGFGSTPPALLARAWPRIVQSLADASAMWRVDHVTLVEHALQLESSGGFDHDMGGVGFSALRRISTPRKLHAALLTAKNARAVVALAMRPQHGEIGQVPAALLSLFLADEKFGRPALREHAEALIGFIVDKAAAPAAEEASLESTWAASVGNAVAQRSAAVFWREYVHDRRLRQIAEYVLSRAARGVQPPRAVGAAHPDADDDCDVVPRLTLASCFRLGGSRLLSVRVPAAAATDDDGSGDDEEEDALLWQLCRHGSMHEAARMALVECSGGPEEVGVPIVAEQRGPSAAVLISSGREARAPWDDDDFASRSGTSGGGAKGWRVAMIAPHPRALDEIRDSAAALSELHVFVPPGARPVLAEDCLLRVSELCPSLSELSIVGARGEVRSVVLEQLMVHCPDLYALSLRGCTGVHGLPVALGRLDDSGLDVHGCPLDELPPEVRPDVHDADRSDRVLRYLKQRLEQGGSAMCDIIKIALVGFAFEGKSTVADLLCGDASSKGRSALDRTIGIDVRSFMLAGHEADGHKPLRACLFDFAGQASYYSSHALFLSARSLFAIVVNLDDWGDAHSARRRRVHAWLDTIHDRCPDAAVVVIGTHVDRLDEATAARRLGTVRSLCATWCEAVREAETNSKVRDVAAVIGVSGLDGRAVWLDSDGAEVARAAGFRDGRVLLMRALRHVIATHETLRHVDRPDLPAAWVRLAHLAFPAAPVGAEVAAAGAGAAAVATADDRSGGASDSGAAVHVTTTGVTTGHRGLRSTSSELQRLCGGRPYVSMTRLRNALGARAMGPGGGPAHSAASPGTKATATKATGARHSKKAAKRKMRRAQAKDKDMVRLKPGDVSTVGFTKDQLSGRYYTDALAFVRELGLVSMFGASAADSADTLAFVRERDRVSIPVVGASAADSADTADHDDDASRLWKQVFVDQVWLSRRLSNVIFDVRTTLTLKVEATGATSTPRGGGDAAARNVYTVTVIGSDKFKRHTTQLTTITKTEADFQRFARAISTGSSTGSSAATAGRTTSGGDVSLRPGGPPPPSAGPAVGTVGASAAAASSAPQLPPPEKHVTGAMARFRAKFSAVAAAPPAKRAAELTAYLQDVLDWAELGPHNDELLRFLGFGVGSDAAGIDTLPSRQSPGLASPPRAGHNHSESSSGENPPRAGLGADSGSVRAPGSPVVVSSRASTGGTRPASLDDDASALNLGAIDGDCETYSKLEFAVRAGVSHVATDPTAMELLEAGADDAPRVKELRRYAASGVATGALLDEMWRRACAKEAKEAREARAGAAAAAVVPGEATSDHLAILRQLLLAVGIATEIAQRNRKTPAYAVPGMLPSPSEPLLLHRWWPHAGSNASGGQFGVRGLTHPATDAPWRECVMRRRFRWARRVPVAFFGALYRRLLSSASSESGRFVEDACDREQLLLTDQAAGVSVAIVLTPTREEQPVGARHSTDSDGPGAWTAPTRSLARFSAALFGTVTGESVVDVVAWVNKNAVAPAREDLASPDDVDWRTFATVLGAVRAEAGAGECKELVPVCEPLEPYERRSMGVPHFTVLPLNRVKEIIMMASLGEQVSITGRDLRVQASLTLPRSEIPYGRALRVTRGLHGLFRSTTSLDAAIADEDTGAAAGAGRGGPSASRPGGRAIGAAMRASDASLAATPTTTTAMAGDGDPLGVVALSSLQWVQVARALIVAGDVLRPIVLELMQELHALLLSTAAANGLKCSEVTHTNDEDILAADRKAAEAVTAAAAAQAGAIQISNKRKTAASAGGGGPSGADVKAAYDKANAAKAAAAAAAAAATKVRAAQKACGKPDCGACKAATDAHQGSPQWDNSAANFWHRPADANPPGWHAFLKLFLAPGFGASDVATLDLASCITICSMCVAAKFTALRALTAKGAALGRCKAVRNVTLHDGKGTVESTSDDGTAGAASAAGAGAGAGAGGPRSMSFEERMAAVEAAIVEVCKLAGRDTAEALAKLTAIRGTRVVRIGDWTAVATQIPGAFQAIASTLADIKDIVTTHTLIVKVFPVDSPPHDRRVTIHESQSAEDALASFKRDVGCDDATEVVDVQWGGPVTDVRDLKSTASDVTVVIRKK